MEPSPVADLLQWSSALIRSAGIPGVFIVSLISASSLFFFPVADVMYIPWSVEVGLKPIEVGIAAGVASALGELVAYGVGRLSRNVVSLRKWMVRTRKGIPAHTLYFTAGRRIKRHTDPQDWSSRYGFWAIPVFAFTPLPMDLLGLALGYLRYNVGLFLLGTLVGKIPRCLLLAYGLFFLRIQPWLVVGGLLVFGAIILASRRIRT